VSNQVISQATWTGLGFPGIAFIVYVDETNGYVLCQLKPWTVYQPGMMADSRTSNQLTYTNAEYDALGLSMSRTKASILRATYTAARDLWTYPVV